MRAVRILVAAAAVACLFGPAVAKHYGGGDALPELNVKGSCSDAQKFSTGDDRQNAYKGCMQDEMAAKDQLKKRWSSFKPKDRSNCVEQSRAPSPSYVEVLTCLEMDTDAIKNAPRVDGKPVPQIGGPVAPGLSSNPASTMPSTK